MIFNSKGDEQTGFYEDFYRVVVQNERFDDWQDTRLQLRKIFSDYKVLFVSPMLMLILLELSNHERD